MVNIRKLRGKMIENGINVNSLAAAIGISASALYRRLSDCGEEFSIKEVRQIVQALRLGYDETKDIFFADFVAPNATNSLSQNAAFPHDVSTRTTPSLPLQP